MENKLTKEYLLKLYKTFNERNMFYALTMLKSLGFSQWFKENSDYLDSASFLVNYPKFIHMFNIDKFYVVTIYDVVSFLDNGIDFFNESQLDKLNKYNIREILKYKPHLKDKLDIKKLDYHEISLILEYQPQLKEFFRTFDYEKQIR